MIARQFMTKLHIQVNQTLQFYRGQQGGAAPQRLFLSGGASIMPYTAQFFAEKLNVPVEYFNPFRNLQISPSVNLEELSRVAHALGEVVGLGLRNLATCPVEMNLMPESTLRWQSFNQKKPYLIATVVSMVLVTFGVGFLFQKLADNKQAEIVRLTPQVNELDGKTTQFKQAYGSLQTAKRNADQIATWMQDRYYWGDFLASLRTALIRSEDDLRKKLSAQKTGAEVGVWIDQITAGTPVNASGMAMMPNMAPTAPVGGYGLARSAQEDLMRRAGYQQVAAPAAPAADPGAQAGVGLPSTNAILLVCRAVSLTMTVDQNANNKDVAYSVRDQIASSPMVDPDPKATQLVGEISPVENGTFTFTLSVTPLNPLKL
jgi:hypothetical protein